MNQREEHRSLYLSYLECCNEHDVDRMFTRLCLKRALVL
jgi:hypothetical protein